MTIDYRDFFDLGTSRAEPFSALPEPALDRVAEYNLVTGAAPATTELTFRRNSDRATPDDLVFGGSPSLLLVSDRFADALRQAGCSGWRVERASLIDEDGSPIETRNLLVVLGRSGPLHAPTEPDDPARPRWARGRWFDEESWDGSDVFAPDGHSGAPIVTRRVKDALEAADLTGLYFEALPDVETWLGR